MSLASPDSLRSNALLRQVWAGLGRPRCYVAGGFLRDHMLGRRSTDLDLSLPGSADEAASPARRLASKLGTRAHLLGRPPRCVWRVDAPGFKVELWPLGGLSLDDDIRRRDFSCNALLWELPNGPLIDRVGGLEDLEQGLIRALSPANLKDDPVRLLRAPRFLAQHPRFKLDTTTAGWIQELAPRLSEAPRARIGQELLLLMRGPSASRGLGALMGVGLMDHAAAVGVTPDRSWFEHNLGAADRLASPRRHPVPGALAEAGDSARLAFLFKGWGTPDPELLGDYGWPRQHRQQATRAASLLDDIVAAANAPAITRRELIHEAGAAFPTGLALAAALEGPPAGWRRWWQQWQRGGMRLVRPPTLLASDEVAVFARLEEGPELGRLLRRLQRAQVRGEVRTRSGARRWLRRQLRDHPHDDQS